MRIFAFIAELALTSLKVLAQRLRFTFRLMGELTVLPTCTLSCQVKVTQQVAIFINFLRLPPRFRRCGTRSSFTSFAFTFS